MHSYFKNVILVSNDFGLIKFDSKSTKNEKIVLHPAKLFGLLLRFTGRITQSEVTSFIKFINIDVNTDEKIPIETVYLINDQIACYEKDPELQTPYLNAIIENSVLDGIQNLPMDQIRTRLTQVFERVEADKRKAIEEKLREKNDENASLKKDAEAYHKIKNITNCALRFALVCGIVWGLYFLATLTDWAWVKTSDTGFVFGAASFLFGIIGWVIKPKKNTHY